MRIPLPAKLDRRQHPDDTRGLVLSTPTITAPASDDNATIIELNGTTHRVPASWDVAEAKHGESDIAILRQGSMVKVLAGDREGRIHEVSGFRRETRDAILQHRFGEPFEQSSDQREVDRLVGLSDSFTPAISGADAAEVDRLVALTDSLDGSTSDDAEANRLAKLASDL